MTKSEIVEALRCAADLCKDAVSSGSAVVEVGGAVMDGNFDAMVNAARCVGVNIITKPDGVNGLYSEEKRFALLEAAQRIEEEQMARSDQRGEPPCPPEKPCWVRIAIIRCDLCDQAACWKHPDGGLRCDDCSRPTK